MLISDFKFELNRDRVFKAVECGKDSTAYEEMINVYEQLKDVLENTVKPEAVLKIDKRPEDYVLKEIKNCEMIVYCAVTLGEEISTKISLYFNKDEYLEALLLDAMANELLFNVSSQLYKRVCIEAEKLNMGLTCRITPGDNETPMIYIRDIIDKLEAERQLNLVCTSSYMLSPIKSLCFFYGADKKLTISEKEHNCINCSNKNCKMRVEDSCSLKIINNKEEIIIKINKGSSIFDNLQRNKVNIISPCSGKGICGKCKIQVLEGNIPVSERDKKVFTYNELEAGNRLACMAYTEDDCTIKIDNCGENDFEIISDFEMGLTNVDSGYEIKTIEVKEASLESQKSLTEIINNQLGNEYVFSLTALRKLSQIISRGNKNTSEFLGMDRVNALIKDKSIVDIKKLDDKEAYGAAVDIGTTTIAISLVDLITGRIVKTYSILNSQRQYGADVISRIEYSTSKEINVLAECVRNDILKGIDELCKNADTEPDNIYSIVIAGNTTMLHIMLGLNCESLGKSPFTTVTKTVQTYRFEEIFKSSKIKCQVVVLPVISAYVGADIVSGMLKCGFNNSNEVSLLIDIGTNGEMAICDGKRIVCLATAAGPAFEGVNITCGTGSIKGAVSSVKINNGAVSYKTIGNKEPVGICGSGVIDIIAEGLKEGIIDETGRLDEEECKCGFIEICKRADGSPITLNQKDIREVQLAKAAIAAGIEVLIRSIHCSCDDIKNVYLAGGFGNKINKSSAVSIGLIPEKLEKRIKAVGNTSLGGAVDYILSRENEKAVKDILNKSTYIELSCNSDFNDLFVDKMLF